MRNKSNIILTLFAGLWLTVILYNLFLNRSVLILSMVLGFIIYIFLWKEFKSIKQKSIFWFSALFVGLFLTNFDIVLASYYVLSLLIIMYFVLLNINASKDYLNDYVNGLSNVQAHRINGPVIDEVLAGEIVASEIVLIKKGDVVPADSRIIKGHAQFCSKEYLEYKKIRLVKTKSGDVKSMDYVKTKGEDISIGSICIEGEVYAEVLRKVKDSYIYRFLVLRNKNLEYKTSLNKLIQFWFDYYFVFVVIMTIFVTMVEIPLFYLVVLCLVFNPWILIFMEKILLRKVSYLTEKKGLYITPKLLFDIIPKVKKVILPDSLLRRFIDMEIQFAWKSADVKEMTLWRYLVMTEKYQDNVYDRFIYNKAINMVGVFDKPIKYEIQGKNHVITQLDGNEVMIGESNILQKYNTEVPSKLSTVINTTESVLRLVVLNRKLVAIIKVKESLDCVYDNNIKSILENLNLKITAYKKDLVNLAYNNITSVSPYIEDISAFSEIIFTDGKKIQNQRGIRVLSDTVMLDVATIESVMLFFGGDIEMFLHIYKKIRKVRYVFYGSLLSVLAVVPFFVINLVGLVGIYASTIIIILLQIAFIQIMFWYIDKIINSRNYG